MDSSLEQFIHSVSGDQYFRVEDDLGNGFVRLRAAEAQRRQALQDIRSFEDVILELLRNSRDAHARAIFLATWTEGSKRFATILDNGDGIPSSMHQTVFEPFVTSKLDSFHSDRWGVHGRGMALYSIKQNVEKATILASQPGLGSVFHIQSDLSRLPEKRDQSTFPSISKNDEGKPVLRGPHNIVRTVMEFAIEERSRISVYLGSSASIVATLYQLATSAASFLLQVFSSYDESTPYIERFAYVADPQALADLANSLGLPLSTRSAHRVLNNEIKPVPLHLEFLSNTKKEQAHTTSSKKKSDTRDERRVNQGPISQTSHGISIKSKDLQRLEKPILSSYKELADAYYLESDVKPTFTCRNNSLVISIPLIAREFTDDY